MGPGARPVQQGENPGNIVQEIGNIRSNYSIHVDADALNVAYEVKGQQRHYRLPFMNMPISGLRKYFAYGGETRAKVSGIMLIDLIRAVENKTGTPLSQQEAEAMAMYASKRTSTMVGAQWFAILGGFFMAWRGRSVMKFPFLRPKPMERYNVFPFGALPILSNGRARLMWHLTRANMYAALFLFAAAPLAGSMGTTQMTVGLYRDSRTHELVKRVGNFDRIQGNRASAGASTQPASQASKTQQSQMTSPQDDASPSAWNDDAYTTSLPSDSSGDTNFTDDSTDTEALNDPNMQRRQARQPPPNAWNRASDKNNQQLDQNRSSSSSDFFFDDASPTAGNDPDMSASQPYSRRPAGSAWESIRRGTNTSQKQNQSQSTAFNRNQKEQNYENREESFTFSPAQEDAQLAKNQAQRDFDAMLDRERRQGGSADYARDMQATEMGEESNTSGSAWERRKRD